MPDRFDEFWTLAVRKKGKEEARREYARAIKRHDEEAILQAWRIQNHVWRLDLGRGKDAHFIVWPCRWLKYSRWQDEEEVRYSAVEHEKSLEIRANHINSRICQFGRYSQEDLMECVDAGLVTLERAQEVGL
jgi:hypothetical protein